MSSFTILGQQSIPHLPWQERSAKDSHFPLWRFDGNPIIGRNPARGVARVFNSGVLPHEGGFIGALRAEKTNDVPDIRIGRSKDGIRWDIEDRPVAFVDSAGKPALPTYAYDPRLVRIEDTYYIQWCQDFYGASIGMAQTKDFKHFQRLENPFIPFNRNAVLFPRKIGGLYTLLSRPSDSGHTPFGDIFLSQSPDMEFWGRHRHVMGRSAQWWESVKIGAGAVPIETSEGWLLIYHGVSNTCNGFVYSIGGALLDIDEPSRVKYRCESYLLTPETPYEISGYVPNVCFPCAALVDAATGRLALYYGAADTCVALAFGYVEEIVAHIKENNKVTEMDTELGVR